MTSGQTPEPTPLMGNMGNSSRMMGNTQQQQQQQQSGYGMDYSSSQDAMMGSYGQHVRNIQDSGLSLLVNP